MDLIIRSKLIKIGNSRGIRIPRTILEQAGLTDEVEIKIEGGRLIIRAARRSRQGWEDRFAAMAQCGDDRLLDETVRSQWDEEEWTW